MELMIDHASKRFNGKTAVSDISLKLTPGVWGLLGANGAGKTTLMPTRGGSGIETFSVSCPRTSAFPRSLRSRTI